MNNQGENQEKKLALKVGDRAPDFELPDQNGVLHKLSDFVPNKKGNYLLIYFYPKDDTTGCTAEACAIRDEMPQFEKLDCQVVGVSGDSVKSHSKFVEKYDLNFTLLSDESRETLNKYGVWQKKKFMGKEYMGIVRSSFLLDPKGAIAIIYDKVKPETHASQVLSDLEKLKNN